MILRIFIVIFNFIVAGLNWKVYLETSESRDFWAAIAWLGAGTSWLMTVIGA